MSYVRRHVVSAVPPLEVLTHLHPVTGWTNCYSAGTRRPPRLPAPVQTSASATTRSTAANQLADDFARPDGRQAALAANRATAELRLTYDQDGALRAHVGRPLRRPPALGAPAGTRRPSRHRATDHGRPSGRASGAGHCRLPRRFRCPAPGHRVEVAPCGRVACDRLRRTSTRHPLARVPAPVEDDGGDQDTPP